MFKYIIVPVTGANTDAPVLATALSIARPGAAHLEFLHARLDIEQVLSSALAVGELAKDAGQDRPGGGRRPLRLADVPRQPQPLRARDRQCSFYARSQVAPADRA